MKKKIKVGTVGLSYSHEKNFYGLIGDRVVYRKTLDWLSPYRVTMRFRNLKHVFSHPILRNIHFAPFHSKVSIFHFFNTISLSNMPWISTFETSLPRWKMDRFGLARISSESCKAIVAMSECAKQIMLAKVENGFPEYLERISSKLSVIHPSQKARFNSIKEKKLGVNESIIFTLVGNDFFRKGGRETIKVFEKLIREGAGVELRLISNLKIGDYASRASADDQSWGLKVISAYPNHIYHFQNIPNSEVMEILKSTHVGLLPTYADTYGYSVLEFQSMGCPVITTDIRALPEINNNQKGWIIPVPKDEFGEGLYKEAEDRKVLSKVIEEGIESTVREILANRSLISERGEKALDGLKVKNDPEMNADLYYALYRKALDYM